MTREELRKYILRQLGYPVVNVELVYDNEDGTKNTDMLDDCINSSLDELRPWYSVFKYETIDMNGQTCIDLSHLNILVITDVLPASNTPSVNPDGSINTTISALSGRGLSSLMWLPMSDVYKAGLTTGTNTSIHNVVSNYANAQRQAFYTRLGGLVEQRTQNALQEDKSWDFIDNKFYLYTSHHYPKVTIEYIGKINDVEDVEDVDTDTHKYIKYLKDLSVAFASQLQARITGKYTDTNSPIKINYEQIAKDANASIERIREELRTTSNSQYIAY